MDGRLLVGLVLGMGLVAGAHADGADVTGRVEMPPGCSTAISPAVVVLVPEGTPAFEAPPPGDPAKLRLVRQAGLQFDPRIQILKRGETLSFNNEDSETHNVHLRGDGLNLSQSVAPGATVTAAPDKAGVVQVLCDVHGHMRAFVVVANSPWIVKCDERGDFRLRDVPAGRYRLLAWHELGDGLKPSATVDVPAGAETVAVPPIALAGRVVNRTALTAGTARPWPEVVDGIAQLLAESLHAAPRADGAARARRLAEDAYFRDFHTSGMEMAVRGHLGAERARELEGRFREFRQVVRAIGRKETPLAQGTEASRTLLLGLSKASEELARKGVTDALSRPAGGPVAESTAGAPVDRAAAIGDLRRAFEAVAEQADAGRTDDAASAMSDVYFDQFEPLERALAVASPGDLLRLESRFNALRGSIGQGERGPELATKLEAFAAEVDARLAEADSNGAGPFAAAFGASLSIVLREGVEVILLLTMLLALAAKSGRPRAAAAVWWGVAAAVVASAVTAVALNRLVASSQGRSRELLEGLVMLAAAAVLFYVSYWLIAQSQTKRWMDFLKHRAGDAGRGGGLLALAVPAFLAVYREGAETALMFQALLGDQGRTSAGLGGLAAGVAIGLAALGVIYWAIRVASLRLPLRAFFQVSGLLLFAMAVVFAGKGVFELQMAGWIKSTPAPWAGDGLPMLGIFPSLQPLAVQGFVVVGAVAAWLTLKLGPSASKPPAPAGSAPVGARA